MNCIRALATPGPVTAVHRNALVAWRRSAYSAPIDEARRRNHRPKGTAMTQATSLPVQARLVAFLGAVLTSATVLGATAFGMNPAAPSAELPMIVLERVTVEAPRIN
jgi:hypothetical protein